MSAKAWTPVSLPNGWRYLKVLVPVAWIHRGDRSYPSTGLAQHFSLLDS